MNDLFRWAEARVADKYRTWEKFGDAAGVNGYALKRAIEAGGSMAIETALRLAADNPETPPSDLLRLADKGDIAELIERLYGSSRPAPIPTSVEFAERLAAADRALAEVRQAVRPFLESPPLSTRETVSPPGQAREAADKRRKQGGQSPGGRRRSKAG